MKDHPAAGREPPPAAGWGARGGTRPGQPPGQAPEGGDPPPRQAETRARRPGAKRGGRTSPRRPPQGADRTPRRAARGRDSRRGPRRAPGARRPRPGPEGPATRAARPARRGGPPGPRRIPPRPERRPRRGEHGPAGRRRGPRRRPEQGRRGAPNAAPPTPGRKAHQAPRRRPSISLRYCLDTICYYLEQKRLDKAAQWRYTDVATQTEYTPERAA